MIAEQWTSVLTTHGEGPLWWPEDGSRVAGRFRCVDLLAGAVVTVDADGASVRADVGDRVAAFLRPRRGGGAVVATEHHLALADTADLSDLRPWLPILEDPDVRFNDGGCDPTGALYAGSMRYDEGAGGAALYRVDGEDVRQVLTGVTVSNGIAWSADGSLAFYNDTPTRTTWVFDWDPERGLHERRPLFRQDEEATGVGPDGLCVDADGTVWTAIFGGSRVEARDRRGRLVEVIELPVSQVTACTFGGPDLRTLYITTSSEGLEPGAEPEAGAVFRAEPGVAGLPVRPFAG